MELLETPGPLAIPGRHLTPYGELTPPLGITRLKAVELVAALLRTDNPAADAGIVASRSFSVSSSLSIER